MVSLIVDDAVDGTVGYVRNRCVGSTWYAEQMKFSRANFE